MSSSTTRPADCFRFGCWLSCWLAFAAQSSLFSQTYVASSLTPPAPKREFRGAWVATVDNIDWPSKKDLSTAEQQAELLTLIERAAKLKLNAIVFQVRPQCDAMYLSKIEPWSEFLTGQMGRPPEPIWDPLAFAIAESHKRGLELHAWFNPYRALHPAAKGPVSPTHVSKTQPQIVRRYGQYLWLDPGERAVQDYSLSVVMDVVQRYDVDGVQFDDYFYPYRSYADPGPDGKPQDFPDEPSWKRFGAGGKLDRGDWRRENVNQFVERVHRSVKAAKPWVKFGISPFGIWRPGHPPQIKGSDAYEQLYADARKWLLNGWLDYFAPQLYWPIAPKDQSFPVLLDWWNDQNPKKRHIWPGLATYKANGKWSSDEILAQIQLAAKQPLSAGHIHYSIKSLGRNPSLAGALEKGPYAEFALVPASTWLGGARFGKPEIRAGSSNGNATTFRWSMPAGESPNHWLLQTRRGNEWQTQVITETTRRFEAPLPDVIAVSAISRSGILSPAGVLERK